MRCLLIRMCGALRPVAFTASWKNGTARQSGSDFDSLPQQKSSSLYQSKGAAALADQTNRIAARRSGSGGGGGGGGNCSGSNNQFGAGQQGGMPLNELIPIINKLQEAFAPLDIPPVDLPQIAVVGSQSSGKSSVLESIVGYDFLPRGTGICTRRPLILQLLHEDVQDYAEFAHMNKKFYSFDDVRRTIELETDKVAGSNKAVSKEPLILRVHSKSVLNLTLVDLPGLTKVPVGDQPHNISEIIRDMVYEVIAKPNCIILAVSAANQDIANSDGLQIAREVDPDGHRTVGVLTKLDLMDHGTDAREVLEGKIYPLRHGYIGVVNRSQRDIDAKLPMREALRSEQTFFVKHHAYSAVAHEQGIPYLSRRLNQILENHIRLHMPEISKKVKYLLREAYEVQERYGGECGQTHREQRAIVVSAIHRFCEAYREIMSGHARNSTKELYGPARIREIFTKDFRKEIESMNSSELTDADIHTARRNAVGVNADLFVPNAAFEVLVKKLIQKMEEPATLCVRLVREELKQVLEDVTSSCNEIGRFEELKEKVNQECMRLLWAKTKEAGEFVTNIVDMEVAYINTENPGFDKFRSGVYKLMAAHHSNIEQQARAQAEAEPSTAAAAAARTTVAKAEYLVRNDWKPHALRIVDRELAIFVNETDETPVRKIPLDQTTAQVTASEDAQSRVLILDTARRGWLSASTDSLQLRFSTEAEASKWLHKLSNAGDGESARMSSIAGGGMAARMSMGVVSSTSRPVHLNDREKLETEVLRQLLEYYFKIVRESITDSVPKAIMLKLVNALQNHLYQHLMESIDTDDDEVLAELTRESEEVSRKRKEVQERVKALKRAIQVMQEL